MCCHPHSCQKAKASSVAVRAIRRQPRPLASRVISAAIAWQPILFDTYLHNKGILLQGFGLPTAGLGDGPRPVHVGGRHGVQVLYRRTELHLHATHEQWVPGSRPCQLAGGALQRCLLGGKPRRTSSPKAPNNPVLTGQ